ncbi:diguanylate cyclase (GGDEF) domain-containing protein [Loktanella fryxellensis]|uniref:diguanylate cyclase n=2 Tax=Loktanella fryxellensis TaxID=245187 RepID=A0A1H8I1D3_9RHOB|nr:diguanylate cyclase (GGDEF) domain-containing protein [Loktanella fryxellensis]
MATRLIRATAPKSRLDAAVKFALFSVAIHLVSLGVEWGLTGRFHMAHGLRFLTTFFSGAPFLWLALYAIGRSYVLHKKLVELAGTDMLTGLMNRRAFVAQAQDLMTDDAGGIVIIIDADHFKQVNDTYGHAVGDMCLRAVAARLRDVTTSDDVLARIGGEEFGIYARRDPATLGLFGNRICATIAVRHDALAAPLHLTLSAGAASRIAGETLDQVMHRADAALYRAKQEGRARLVTWTCDTMRPDDAPGASTPHAHANPVGTDDPERAGIVLAPPHAPFIQAIG